VWREQKLTGGQYSDCARQNGTYDRSAHYIFPFCGADSWHRSFFNRPVDAPRKAYSSGVHLHGGTASAARLLPWTRQLHNRRPVSEVASRDGNRHTNAVF
jgi:hypothetical protein